MASVDGRPKTAGSFRPGETGNPGGRPPDKEIAALARRYTPDIIRTWVEVCRNAIDNPSARVAAANALADRGYGKPRQEVELSGGMGQALHLHLYAVQRLEQARAVADSLEAPPIEGTVEDFSETLLPRAREALPHEALPLWDAAAEAESPAEAEPPAEPSGEPAGEPDGP